MKKGRLINRILAVGTVFFGSVLLLNYLEEAITPLIPSPLTGALVGVSLIAVGFKWFKIQL